MVRYCRFHQLKKGEQIIGEKEEAFPFVVLLTNSGSYMKRWKPKLLSLLFLSLLSCFFLLVPHLFCASSAFSPLDSFARENETALDDALNDTNSSVCSSIPKASIIGCDRSGFRSDICFMKGDIRTHSLSSSIFLYTSQQDADGLGNYVSRSIIEEDGELQHEKIKPYTRKWETSIMDTIQELSLIRRKEKLGVGRTCDVHHDDVPAVFFSTGGYTGNVYHEFNDGLLPLYITSQHFKKKVVFVILEYHNWWKMKYRDIISHLSDYPVVDFSGDERTHCFPEAIVGLRIHGELAVDPSLMQENKSINDFRNLLNRAYSPRIPSLIQQEELRLKKEIKKLPEDDVMQKPRLVILSRNGSRAMTNEDSLVKIAKKIGFQVEVLRPDRKTELAKIYGVLNSSDVMVGVHGAAMTHFLFMRPGCVFIQIIPLGTDWAAETYYGEPARKLGLKYIGYPILPRESSLYDEYDKDNPVLRDPRSITKKGWEFTKKIYLDHQTVKLDLRRFKKQLLDAYAESRSKISSPHTQYSCK